MKKWTFPKLSRRRDKSMAACKDKIWEQIKKNIQCYEPQFGKKDCFDCASKQNTLIFFIRDTAFWRLVSDFEDFPTVP